MKISEEKREGGERVKLKTKLEHFLTNVKYRSKAFKLYKRIQKKITNIVFRFDRLKGILENINKIV